MAKEKRSILSYFPYETPREQQSEVLLAIEKHWDKHDNFIIVAPTASGKSSIAKTIASWRFNCAIIAPTNLLVQQYAAEFPGMSKLQKRELYQCPRFANGELNCKSASSKFGRKKMGCNLDCEYLKDNRMARGRGYFVCNYYTYMSNKLFKANLIIDECIGGDTYILSKEGVKSNSKISTIYNKFIKGEEIWVSSINTTTGKLENKKVTNAWKNPIGSKSLIKFSTSSASKLIATSDHLFLSEKGWMTLKEIWNKNLKIVSTGKKVPYYFSGDSDQVILGSLLGDGHLGKNPNSENARISIVNKQEEYAKFKARMLGGARIDKCFSGFKEGSFSYRVTSKTVDAKEYSFDEILHRLNEKGLAIWFMDDGSAHIHPEHGLQRITFHTEAYSLEENEQLIKVLKARFNVTANLFTSSKPDGRTYYYLGINKENSQILYDLIGPYLHESMSHKLKPKDVEAFIPQHPIKYSRITNYNYINEDYVYDIEVEDNHNFIITEGQLNKNGLVAHNCHNIIKVIQDMNGQKLWRHDYNYPWSMWTHGDILSWLESELEDCSRSEHQIEILAGLKEELTSQEPRYIIKRGYDTWNRGSIPEERELLTMMPVDVRDAPPYIWPNQVQKIVMMSATVSYKDIENLGLDRRRTLYLEVDSPIPSSHRPIITDYVANVNRSNLRDSTISMAQRIREIYLPKYEGKKGVIHATYAQSKIFREVLGDNERFMFHDKTNTRAQYQAFLDSPPESGRIFVASGLYEGIDLAEDLGRFQIITKIPWLNLGDSAIKYKAERDQAWFCWETLKSTMQACGRICRTPEDFGETIIMDMSFTRLVKQGFTYGLIPSWWREALPIELQEGNF